jgi:hypothetical protein
MVLGFTTPVYGQQTSYLPLSKGRQWTLASGGTSMRLSVVDQNGPTYRVKWDNPWVAAEFYYQPSGNQVLLTGLDMGNGVANFSASTVYFDFDAPQGHTWSNVLGKMTVAVRGAKVETPAGVFTNCIEIHARSDDGSDTYWTFAPGTGFVRFGRGGSAFLLTSVSGSTPASPPAQRRAGTAEARTSPAIGSAPIVIGLESNPAAGEGYGEDAKRNSLRLTTDAGATVTFVHPKWDEVEPRAGQWEFGDVEQRIRLAVERNLPVILNLRVIDGNHRSIPSEYQGWRFDDARMAEKLRQVLRQLAPRTRARVRWVQIGNEVDHYFASRRGEIGPYAALIRNVIGEVRSLFPCAQFAINFSDKALPELNGAYGPLVDLSEFISYNYYPLNDNFTFRDPEGCRAEMNSLIAAAGGKPVFFQELGYSSSSVIGSSQARQRRFVEVVFEVLASNRGNVVGANFNWLSDLPQPVVNQLGSYYGMDRSRNFKEFIGTLGWSDQNGNRKEVWRVFEREAQKLRQ